MIRAATTCWRSKARITLETDDKQPIYMHWKGLRHDTSKVRPLAHQKPSASPTTPGTVSARLPLALARRGLAQQTFLNTRIFCDATTAGCFAQGATSQWVLVV